MSTVPANLPPSLVVPPKRGFPWPSRQRLPLLMTVLVLALAYGAAGLRYENFFTAQTAINLLADNAFLGVAAVGMTFVILSGGIDLSVGTAIGCTTVVIASLCETHHWHPLAAMAVVLAGGTLVGAAQGLLIALFELQPFLVTLGGLFLYRGVALLVSQESVSLTHPLYTWLSEKRFVIGESVEVPVVAVLFLGLLGVAAWFAAYRPGGRAVYALGGSEQSALMMGLPTTRLKVGVYAFGGFCAALAGITATISIPSGSALTANGLELDAIAAVVIGGTLLSGGVGGPVGTLLGVLIFGIFQQAILYENVTSWWGRIVVGLLLLTFVLLQTLLQPRETHA